MRAVTMTLLTLSVMALGGGGLDAQHRPSNVLTAEEIVRAESDINTAYDAVARLRPRWLQVHDLSRLPANAGDQLQGAPIRVYLNDFGVGDVEFLKTIPAASIAELRWLSQNETAGRYGPSDGQTAIVVTLLR